jgi:NADH dehydrogenase
VERGEAGSEILPVGTVIDQANVDAEGCWSVSAKAEESCDVMVFRGRALELLRGDLRLVKR